MKQELDEQLCTKYPTIFKDRHGDIRHTLMPFGFECGDGWFKLIDELCAKLQAIADITGYQTVASQIKEKFGGLRFYVYIDSTGAKGENIWMNIIYDIISEAEHRSNQICEVCGDYGENTAPNGWYRTLCEKCREPIPG